MNVKGIENYEVEARTGYSSVFNGSVGQVLQNKKGKEYFRRSPGVRAIIVTKTGLIFQKEKREYLASDWDYRLPGGKVVDTLAEYLEYLSLKSEDVIASQQILVDAITREVREEIGVIVQEIRHYHTSESSATVEHDLHYYVVEKFSVGEASPEEDEEIQMVEMTYKEVFKLLLNREFSEDRTRAVLFEYLLTEKRDLIF